MTTDLQHDIQHEYCTKLTKRLREVISSKDAFDVTDVTIVEVEFLILAYLALHRAELAACYPPPDEVQGWADRFVTEFDSRDWSEEEVTEEKIGRMRTNYLDLLSTFQKICFDYQ